MAIRHSTGSRTSKTSTDLQSEEESQTQQDSVRQQFGQVTQRAETLLRTVEVWQQAQLQLTKRARTSYHDAAERISQSGNPAELMSIQAGLLMSGWQNAIQFGMDLMSGALAQQAESGESAQLASGTGDAGANMGMAAMAPMVQAWQSMFTAASSNSGSPTAH